jgi:ankyrin repeat protein
VNIHLKNDYAFRWASYNGQLNIVKYLMETTKVNIHAGENGALRWAYNNNHLEVIKYVLNIGIQPLQDNQQML